MPLVSAPRSRKERAATERILSWFLALCSGEYRIRKEYGCTLYLSRPRGASQGERFSNYVDGLLYLKGKRIPHYGRFTEMERPARMQHTWVSPNTPGEESTVTVTFKKRGEDTLMTLIQSPSSGLAKATTFYKRLRALGML